MSDSFPTKKPLLPYSIPLLVADFINRPNRFVIEVRIDGRPDFAHTNNTGSMMGLLRTGRQVLLSDQDPTGVSKRKYRYQLEQVRIPEGWVGVNTQTPNRLLKAAWEQAAIPELVAYTSFQPEAVIGKSRLDGLFQATGLPDLYVECKNTTLVEHDVAVFPDAVTARGLKHLEELSGLVERGCRAACLFLVQRPDGHCFGPADMVDEAYTRGFWKAVEQGVEMWPWRARTDKKGIWLEEKLPLVKKRNI